MQDSLPSRREAQRARSGAAPASTWHAASSPPCKARRVQSPQRAQEETWEPPGAKATPELTRPWGAAPSFSRCENYNYALPSQMRATRCPHLGVPPGRAQDLTQPQASEWLHGRVCQGLVASQVTEDPGHRLGGGQLREHEAINLLAHFPFSHVNETKIDIS